MGECGPGARVWGFYAGPFDRVSNVYEPPCPVLDAGACWNEVTLCTPRETACWRAARISGIDISSWEFLLIWDSGDPLYRSVPKALVKRRKKGSSHASGWESACAAWPKRIIAIHNAPPREQSFQDKMFQAVTQSVIRVREKHSCQNRAGGNVDCTLASKERRGPGITLHLSFVLNSHDAALVGNGRIGCILKEIAKVDACFEDVIITTDVPPPKNAEHSSRVLSSSLGLDMIARARQDLRQGLPKLMTRCHRRPHGAVIAMDYSKPELLRKMATAFSQAFGLVHRGTDVDSKTWLLNVIGRMFKSTPQQFYVYAHARTDLILHQDGDRGLQFKHESQIVRRAIDAFAAVPHLFYIGLPPCAGLDESQDMFHRQYLGGDRPFEDFGRSVASNSIHEPQIKSILRQHWSEYGGHVFRQHISMCGFIMNLSRFRALWPFQHLDRHIDLLHDANVERFLWNPSEPALATYMAADMSSEGCAVGQEAGW